jgi:hypothetical protein
MTTTRKGRRPAKTKGGRSMVEVYCVRCRGAGKVPQVIGQDRLGRPMTLVGQCPFCLGRGSLQVRIPSESWLHKSKEAQRLARAALKRFGQIKAEGRRE